MKSPGSCLACGDSAVELLLDAGPQPLCNHFPKNDREPEFLHPMHLGVCLACGAAQLIGPAPAAELKPKFDWMTYNEPEAHLDDLADRLMKLPGIGPESSVCGVSFKDDSLLRRLRERGIRNVWRVDPAQDLGEPDTRAAVETVQALLTPEAARHIAQRRGKADLVIARHIFEHSHRPAEFINALCSLAKPDGWLDLEAPDCTRALREHDYSVLWEEHTLYLTPSTFQDTLTTLGAQVEHFESHPYAMENSMVALARIGTRRSAARKTALGGIEQVRTFAAALPNKRRELQNWADGVRGAGGKIAVFGAGHLGTVWVNVLGLGDRVAFFVDDNAHKQNLRMPGSRLPIYGSAALIREGVTWALMAFTPENEPAVIAKNSAFLERGGRFASIFDGSPRALRTELAKPAKSS